jgi:DNA-binding transcriptional ArsR family regulator
MSSEDTFDLIFKALADAKRRKILDLLKESPKTTGDLCKKFSELDRCTVMQHLGVLENAELIIVERKGRYRWNYLNPIPIKEIFDRWISEYATGAITFLDKLKKNIED